MILDSSADVVAPPSSSGHDTLEVVSFMAGGHRFAVEAAQVRTQLPASALPTQIAAEQLLGLSDSNTQNPAHRRILLLKHPAGNYAVAVSAPVELRSLKIADIHPLPALIAARSQLPGIRGLTMEAKGVTVLVDLLSFQRPGCA